MAKKRPKTRRYKQPTYGKIRDIKRPRWMRILFIVAIILGSAVGILGFIGAVIKYYRLVTK